TSTLLLFQSTKDKGVVVQFAWRAHLARVFTGGTPVPLKLHHYRTKFKVLIPYGKISSSRTQHVPGAGSSPAHSVYAGHAGDLSPGRAHLCTRNQQSAFGSSLARRQRHATGRARSVFRRQLPSDLCFRPRRHALHYFVDHFALDDGRL